MDEAIAGGLNSDKDLSYQIAVSEFHERMAYSLIANNSQLHKKWGIDFSNSTDGFAFGYDSRKTFMRALCESSERWIFSNWIDFNSFKLNMVSSEELKKQFSTFTDSFDELLLFKKRFKIKYKGTYFNACIYLSIGLSKTGAFPGSRVVIDNDNDGWEHAMLESWRHYKFSKNSSEDRGVDNNIVKRVMYFARNKKSAMDQIIKAQKEAPSIDQLICEIRKTASMKYNRGIVWRCLSKNYIPWEKGREDRFVY